MFIFGGHANHIYLALTFNSNSRCRRAYILGCCRVDITFVAG